MIYDPKVVITPQQSTGARQSPSRSRVRTQIAFAAAAALAAFVIVTLGAVLTYTVVAGPSLVAASAASGGSANPAAPDNGSVQAPPAPDSFGRPQGQQPEQGQNVPNDSPDATSYPVSADQAAQIALSLVPGASLVQQPRLVNAGGIVAYEVPLDRGTLYVDANTGRVLNAFGGRHRRGR